MNIYEEDPAAFWWELMKISRSEILVFAQTRYIVPTLTQTRKIVQFVEHSHRRPPRAARIALARRVERRARLFRIASRLFCFSVSDFEKPTFELNLFYTYI